jgi:hypothetical protein
MGCLVLDKSILVQQFFTAIFIVALNESEFSMFSAECMNQFDEFVRMNRLPN